MTLCTYRTHINRLTFPATLEELVPNIREFWRFSLHYKCSYRPDKCHFKKRGSYISSAVQHFKRSVVIQGVKNVSCSIVLYQTMLLNRTLLR